MVKFNILKVKSITEACPSSKGRGWGSAACQYLGRLWSADASLGMAVLHVDLVEFLADFLWRTGQPPLLSLLNRGNETIKKCVHALLTISDESIMNEPSVSDILNNFNRFELSINMQYSKAAIHFFYRSKIVLVTN